MTLNNTNSSYAKHTLLLFHVELGSNIQNMPVLAAGSRCHSPVAGYVVFWELHLNILNWIHCSSSFSSISGTGKGDRRGSPLTTPSVPNPPGRRCLAYFPACRPQIAAARTQSRTATAAARFIKEKNALQRNPVPQLALTACVIRHPEQMKHGVVRWSRLLHLLKGCFHHWSVIWNLFADTFAPFQTN